MGKGFRVFGSVRKQADADRLQKEFGAAFVPLLFDVTRSGRGHGGARKRCAEALERRALFGLVNNAGIAVSGRCSISTSRTSRHQLDVNILGPMIVTQAFAPLLAKRTAGSPRAGS